MKHFLHPTTLLCAPVALLLFAACSEAGPKDPDADDDASGNASSQSGSSSGATTSTNGGGAGVSAGGGQSGGQGGSSGSSAGMTVVAGQGGSAVGVGGGSGGGAGSGAGSAGQSGSAGSGTAASGGLGAGGGAGAAAGGTSMAGAAGGMPTGIGLGNGIMTGSGTSMMQYETTEVGRNGVPYELITNGWGPGFDSHTVSWNGTSFIVEAMMGSRGSGGQPASYPSVFCGQYSVKEVPACGLPKAMDQITTLKTGWRWNANGNMGAYNAAYDIWLGTDTGFGMYLMVWLRDPPGEQPAGSPNAMHKGITVANVPGVWDIWNGTVNNRPIINWVRQEGMDSPEIEFDVMDFIRDAQTRGLTITGNKVNAVAVGFEIWSGPITNLESNDFYVDVK